MLLLPEALEDYIAAENPVRFIDALSGSSIWARKASATERCPKRGGRPMIRAICCGSTNAHRSIHAAADQSRDRGRENPEDRCEVEQEHRGGVEHPNSGSIPVVGQRSRRGREEERDGSHKPVQREQANDNNDNACLVACVWIVA